jgi:hypothetical protein
MNIRQLSLGLLALASVNPAHAGPKVLIDFGTSATFRGASVSSPDSNGKYWNGISPAAYTANMVDTSGAATTIDLGFDSSGATVNTDSYNGPAGATSTPIDQPQIDATEINAAALGDLGIKEAAFDFVSSTGGRFQIQGLDPLKRYKLTFYGSAKFQADNTTYYRVFDDSAFSSQIAEAMLEVHPAATPWLNNQDKTATVSGLIPSLGGTLFIEFGGSSGNSGKLNAMSVEDSPVAVTGPAVLVDFGNVDSFRGVSVTNPDGNGNHWNSVRAGLYWPNLLDTTGAATTIGFGFSTPVSSDSYNGPAGATSTPPTSLEIAAAAIDATAMGILGVKEAAIDYVSAVDGVFEVAGLNATKKYNLFFYGSKKYVTDAATVYSVYDDNALTNLVAETNLRVGKSGFADHNPGGVAVVRDLTPSAGGALYVKFTGASGASGYLNSMIVEQVVAADTTAPVITITEFNPVDVTWGSTYVDAGATASDDVDGSVTVTPGGSVDTSLLGAYQITYTATDATANSAQAIRTVNVILPPDANVSGDDGFSPLEKYAFGGDGPDSTVERPVVAKVGGDLVLTAVVRTNDSNLAVLGQSSTDLVTWADLAVNPAGVASANQAGVSVGAQRRDFTLPSGGPKRFLHLKITSP